MIRWNVRNRAITKGWTNPNLLALGAGLTYPVARRVWQGEAVDRLDADTLEKLRVAFKTRTPWTLLDYVPEKPKRA